MKTHAEIRFEKSRKRLAEVLKNLEEVVKEKLHETAINSTMLSVSDDGVGNSQAHLIEQSATIQNLNEEINKLQKTLSDLGKETEFLTEINKTLGTKISEFRTQQKSLISAIEADLISIKEVIENHDH